MNGVQTLSVPWSGLMYARTARSSIGKRISRLLDIWLPFRRAGIWSRFGVVVCLDRRSAPVVIECLLSAAMGPQILRASLGTKMAAVREERSEGCEVEISIAPGRAQDADLP